MRSMFTAKPPHSRTSARASTMSCAVCLRPMASSTESVMVWGFTLILSTPCRRSVLSFSIVIVSGRPASTVYSRRPERSNSDSSFEHSRSS